MASSFGFRGETIQEAVKLNDLSRYSNVVEKIAVENLRDRKLLDHLSSESKGTLLFTGGGIAPAKMLSIEHLKFIHIHPGYLPEIRGADCALWSYLYSGRFSASCFYLAPGIDMGDIISSHWLPEIDLKFLRTIENTQLWYRVIYSFIDPWIRSYILRKVLNENSRYGELETVSQKPSDGITFHFMHNKLKCLSLSRF